MTQALACGREERSSCCFADRQEAGLSGGTSPCAVSVPVLRLGPAERHHSRVAHTHHWVILSRFQQRQGKLKGK